MKDWKEVNNEYPKTGELIATLNIKNGELSNIQILICYGYKEDPYFTHWVYLPSYTKFLKR